MPALGAAQAQRWAALVSEYTPATRYDYYARIGDEETGAAQGSGIPPRKREKWLEVREAIARSRDDILARAPILW